MLTLRVLIAGLEAVFGQAEDKRDEVVIRFRPVRGADIDVWCWLVEALGDKLIAVNRVGGHVVMRMKFPAIPAAISFLYEKRFAIVLVCCRGELIPFAA